MEQEQVKKMDVEIGQFAVGLKLVSVVDGPTYEFAGEQLVSVRGWRKKIDVMFDAPIKAAYEAHRAIVAVKRRFTDVLDLSERDLETKRSLYRAEQKKIADAKAAEARARLKFQAEDEQLAEALRLDEAGEHDEAADLINQPVTVPAVIVQPNTPKTDGLSVRRNWKFRVVDPTKVPREFLKVDDVKLGQYARAMKDQGKVAGVEFYFEETEAGVGR